MTLFSLPRNDYTNDKKSYINLGAFRVEDILPLINGNGAKATLFGFNNEPYTVKVHSDRLQVFKNSVRCVSCMREGNIFLLQSSRSVLRKVVRTNCFIEDCAWCYYSFLNTQPLESPHLNLWSQDNNGDYCLMTKDHIRPRSRGGSNDLKNLQTMCRVCNNKKGNSLQ